MSPSEEFYNKLFETSFNERYVFSEQTLQFLSVTRGACRNLGYSLQTLQAMTPLDIKPEYNSQSFAQIIEPLRDGSQEFLRFETVHRRKDGSHYPVDIHLQLHPNNKDRVFVATVLDISERLEAQRQREKQAASIQLIEAMTVMANAGANIDQSLRKALSLIRTHTGWALAHAYLWSPSAKNLEFTSARIWESADDRDFSEFMKASEEIIFKPSLGMVGTVVATQTPLWFEGVDKRDDSCRRQLAHKAGIKTALALPVTIGEEVAAVIELFDTRLRPPDEELLELLTNVSTQLGRVIERQRARKLRQQLLHTQKLNAIGRLAGGIAHDFNNCLAVIKPHVEFVLDDAHIDAQSREDLHVVCEVVDNAAHVTRRLLSFSRDQHETRRPLSLNQVVGNVVKMIRPLLGEHIELIHELDPKIPDIVADAVQLEQVLVNLVINARDALHDGGRVVLKTDTVVFETAYDGHSPGTYALFSVRDNGIGIDPAHHSRIFDAFFTTKEKDCGTGLGLSIVHRIIRQHDGWIELDSRRGQGTEFRIFLPKGQISKSTDEGHTLHRPHITSNCETILVVEDQDQLRSTLRRLLERRGYRVIVASHAKEALKLLRSPLGAGVDLVLLDMVMPGMGGRKLAELIDNTLPHVSILLMSAYSSAQLPQGDRPEQLPLIRKPFDSETLVQAIEGTYSISQNNVAEI